MIIMKKDLLMRPSLYVMTITLVFLAGCASQVHPELQAIVSTSLAPRKASVFDYPAHFPEIYNTKADNKIPKELDDYFNK
jgi:hypothetical protein